MLSEVPPEWEWTRIGQHFQRVARKNTAGVTRVLTASGKHGLIDQEEFFNKRIAAAKLTGYFHLKRGEFAYNRSSMNGYPCGAIKRLDRYDDGVLSTLYLCFGLRQSAGVLSDYAAQLFDSGQLDTELRPIVRVGARAHGLLNVTPGDFMEVSFPLPPLPEQKKIGAILYSVDEAIQATQVVVKQTRRVKEGLLQALVTRGIGHTRFKKTEIGEIPEGWEIAPLGNYLSKASVQNGLYKPASDYGDSGVPIIRIDSFQHGGRVALSRLRRVNVDDVEAEKFLVKDDDILLNRVNSLSHLAKSAIVKGVAEATVFESNMMRLRLDTRLGLRPGFLIAVMSLPCSRNHFQLRAKKAVAQASVNQGDLRALPVPVPPSNEQKQIEGVLAQVDSRIESEESVLRRYKHVKAGLLQDLLTGTIRVSV